MGKGGTILGLIGVLLGAGAFGFIIWNTLNTSQTPIWYRYYNDIYEVADSTYQTIPNMSISIDLSKTASINLLFTCQASTVGTTGRSDLTFYFYIDETIISTPNTRVGTYDGEPTTYFHSVSLRYFSKGWSIGAHNISVYVGSTVTNNSIQNCALTVQSFQSKTPITKIFFFSFKTGIILLTTLKKILY